MKRTLVLLLLTAFALVTKAQTDLTFLGIKGKVLQTVLYLNGNRLYTNTFDADGWFKNYYFELNFYGLPVTITKRTKTGLEGMITISGQSFGCKFVKKNGLLSKFTVNDGKGDMTLTFTYTNGLLTRADESYVYYTEDQIEYGANLTGVDNYYNEINAAADEYYKDLERMSKNPLNMLNPYGTANKINKSANRAANRISKAASGVGVKSYARTKKTRHEDKHYTIYQDYTFDDFGNWVTRRVNRDGMHWAPEVRHITYDKDYWSNFYWTKLKPTADLRRIEAFATNTMCSEKYKKEAADFWNSRILDEVARIDGNNLDSLCHVSASPIISSENREKAMNIVRERIWKDNVLPLNDFKAVADMKYATRGKMRVFDTRYMARIDSLSSALRTDSLERLRREAQNAYNDGSMSKAVGLTRCIQNIEPGDALAQDIRQKAEYSILKSKEADMTVTVDDYTAFLDTHQQTEHAQELQDKRILLASSLFDRNTTSEEFDRVLGMPASAKAHKTAEKRKRKWEFKQNCGSFFHIGIGGDFAVGASNTVAGGGLLVRMGYTANILNLVTGVRYNYLTSTSEMFKTPTENAKAYFERQYLSVPVMLHVNVLHGYTGCTYVGLGAELNVATLSAALRDVEKVKENKLGNGKTTITPRFAVGGRFFGFEAEIFATYDMKNPFDVDFVKGYTLSDGTNVSTHCDPNVYDKQIVKDGFFDKLRGGVALRLWL